MLKNEPSLLSNSSSKTPKDKSRRYFSSELDLIIKPYVDTARITIAVSKKVAARAVDRNRIKRIIKEATRKTGNHNMSLVFKVKKNIANLKSHQVEEIIKKLLSKND